jgi:hypothetical protein
MKTIVTMWNELVEDDSYWAYGGALFVAGSVILSHIS